MEITTKSNIIDVLNAYPISADILQKYGVNCIGCMMSHSESFEEGLSAHGLDAEKILEEIKESGK
jgi:hybrid cluster-associated redox disulfide protein